MNDLLSEAIDTLQEIKRMHQLNLELLEQLDVSCGWLLESKVHLPNERHFVSLLTKARALLSEIQAETPKTLIYQKLSDGFSQRKKSDKDFTVPY